VYAVHGPKHHYVARNCMCDHASVFVHACTCLCVCVFLEIYTVPFFLVGCFKHHNGWECGSVESVTVV
jgi:hypothetical protein